MNNFVIKYEDGKVIQEYITITLKQDIEALYADVLPNLDSSDYIEHDSAYMFNEGYRLSSIYQKISETPINTDTVISKEEADAFVKSAEFGIYNSIRYDESIDNINWLVVLIDYYKKFQSEEVD